HQPLDRIAKRGATRWAGEERLIRGDSGVLRGATADEDARRELPPGSCPLNGAVQRDQPAGRNDLFDRREAKVGGGQGLIRRKTAVGQLLADPCRVEVVVERYEFNRLPVIGRPWLAAKAMPD